MTDAIKNDLQTIWHPCTQMKDHETIPLIMIEKGEGVYLIDDNGNRYIDAISSWWVNIFGHNNSYIKEKIFEQMQSLEHVIFAGFTHKQAIQLAQRICHLTQGEKVFFADNGSSGVEVALKMSFHYHQNNNQHRPLFAHLQGSYHGETLGALAVGDLGLYKEAYQPLLLQPLTLPTPNDHSLESVYEVLPTIKSLLHTHKSELSAVIVEPLVQCAGGMLMHHPFFLQTLKNICEEYGIHFIADEIAVSFGRTGKLFACDDLGFRPDFRLLSKGLTGGFLPLALVVTTNTIYDCFYEDYDPQRTFLHSHSYTANPLACAAANAVLDIFEHHNGLQLVQTLTQHMYQQLQRFQHHKGIKNLRQCGTIGVIEIEDTPLVERPSLYIREFARNKGVILRPLGNVIYVMPPYIITEDELSYVFDVIESCIQELFG